MAKHRCCKVVQKTLLFKVNLQFCAANATPLLSFPVTFLVPYGKENNLPSPDRICHQEKGHHLDS